MNTSATHRRRRRRRLRERICGAATLLSMLEPGLGTHAAHCIAAPQMAACRRMMMIMLRRATPPSVEWQRRHRFPIASQRQQIKFHAATLPRRTPPATMGQFRPARRYTLESGHCGCLIFLRAPRMPKPPCVVALRKRYHSPSYRTEDFDAYAYIDKNGVWLAAPRKKK